MNDILAGRSALVTGGSAGMGLASAELLARDGAAVTLMGRSEKSLAEAKAMLVGAVPDARIALCPGNAANDADVEKAVAAATLHGGSLDIVVATVGGGTFGAVLEISADQFMTDVERNLRPAFLAVRVGAPAMKNGGSFVFISSTVAVMPVSKLPGYSAGKAGLDQFVRATAIELGGRGIRLNAVRPGLTRTPGHVYMADDPAIKTAFLAVTPLGRLGESIDIGQAVRFLCGPESSWITGQCLSIDGGNELRGSAMG